ncbi:MAG: ATP-dependent metallopeptidase FtsH/Yme1/Tma family protein, partial [Geobacteraceae bacterium]|nr:ATP-dependent metallopeptidase FtsH/Yme1/Tma family protein [Geobacteraceae bacterium]
MKSNWNRVLLFMLAIIALNAGFAYLFPSTPQEPQALVSYSRFKEILNRGNIAEVTLENKRVSGRFKERISLEQSSTSKSLLSGGEGKDEGETRDYIRFRTVLPPVDDPNLLPLLEKQGVDIEANIVED